MRKTTVDSTAEAEHYYRGRALLSARVVAFGVFSNGLVKVQTHLAFVEQVNKFVFFHSNHAMQFQSSLNIQINPSTKESNLGSKG